MSASERQPHPAHALLRERRISQETVARWAGVSHQHLARGLLGERPLSLRVKQVVAGRLGLPVEECFR